eukprot:gene19052-19402_t
MIVSRPKFDSRDANSFEPQASLLVLDETAVDNILVNSAIKFNETYERQGASKKYKDALKYGLKAIGNMQAQVAQSRSYNRMEAGQDSDIEYMWGAGSGRDHGYDNNENVENNPARTGGYYLLADPNLFNATDNKNLTDSQIESLHFHLLEVFYSVAGTQEYDPTLQRHADYRSFLMSRSRCVEVVCMSSHSWKMAKVKQQIQFLFRLKY